MAAQLAFALFGWLDAPAQSIFRDAATVVGNADQKDAKSLEDKYLVAGPQPLSTLHSLLRYVAQSAAEICCIASRLLLLPAVLKATPMVWLLPILHLLRQPVRNQTPY